MALLGILWAQQGHEVFFGSRDAEKEKQRQSSQDTERKVEQMRWLTISQYVGNQQTLSIQNTRKVTEER